MSFMRWTVNYRGQAKKALKPNNRQLSVDARDAFDALHLDLEEDGPVQKSWPNYGKLKGSGRGLEKHHCHLLRGRPTYVACWEVVDKSKRVLEVYYVGTHEKAPY